MVKNNIYARSGFFVLFAVLFVYSPIFAAQESLIGALPTIYNAWSRAQALWNSGSALVSSDPHAPASERGILANAQRCLARSNQAVRWAKLGVFLQERTDDLGSYITEHNQFKGRMLDAFAEGRSLDKVHSQDGDQEAKLSHRLTDVIRCHQEALEAFMSFRADPQLSTAQQAAYFLQASKRLSVVNADLIPPVIAKSLKEERKKIRPSLTNFFSRQSQAGLLDLVNKGFFNDYRDLYDSDNEGQPKTIDELSLHAFMQGESGRLTRATSEPYKSPKQRLSRATSEQRVPIGHGVVRQAPIEQEEEDGKEEDNKQTD